MDNDDSTSSADPHRVSSATKACQPFRKNLDHSYCEQSLDTNADDGLGEHCQVEVCTMPPPYSVDGSTPAILSGNHLGEDMQHVQQDGVSFGRDGTPSANKHDTIRSGGREAELKHKSQEGNIDRFCSEHKRMGIVAAKATHCEYLECPRTPRYGPSGAPPSFCQSHKRAGMYTVRGGMIFMATRDGNAFRTVDNAAEDTGATAPGLPMEASQTASGSGRHPAPREPCQKPTVVPGKIMSDGRTTLLSRKLCEVLGCQVQPSYGFLGTTRLRFCSGHKQEGMVALKNRPCIYPGCTTRPHYGLPQGRTIYCSKHKHDGMVYVLKKGQTSGTEENPRRREECSPSWQKGRLLITLPRVARQRGKRAKNVRAEEQHERQVDATDDKQKGGVDERGAEKRNTSKRKAVAAGTTSKKRTKRTNPVDSPTPSTLASPSTPAAAAFQPLHDGDPTIPAETSPDVAEAVTAPPPVATEHSGRRSRLAGPSGMTPSVEMKLFHEARESARMAAEASGSGRRARAPSRKALEASGKLRNEGVQWLTREKKEEQARLKKELKEQRKAAAAAGLKAGQVIEALAAPVAVGGAVVGGVGDGEAIPLKINWRKLTPVEILQAAGQQLVQGKTAKQPHGGQTAATAESGVVACMQDANAASIAGAQDRDESVKGTLEASTALGADSVTTGNENARKSTFIAKPRDGLQDVSVVDTAKTDRANDDGDIQNSSSEKGDRVKGGTTEGGETGAVQTLCVFPRCAKNATFGVNGSARYCETHHLFGMRKMSGKP